VHPSQNPTVPHDLLDTVDLAYTEYGATGRPLVLLHGLGGSQDDWPLQLPFFSPRYRVICVDLRGHGRSPKPPGLYRMSQFAADLALLLMRLEAHPAHVLGLSLGGAVAQQLAVDHPDLVRSLVLVNTLARFLTTQWRQRLLGARRFLSTYLRGIDAVADDIAVRLFPMVDQAELRAMARTRLASNDPAAYRASLWAVARFDVTFLLDLIDCPVLVVAGDRDATLPLEPKRQLADRLPNARFQLIENSAHATPIDQPGVFNDLVLDFLKDVDRTLDGTSAVS
jgi:pimeloyl-ACP methyl ester carboxylesterase